MIPVLLKHLPSDDKVSPPACLADHRGKHVFAHVKETCPPRTATLAFTNADGTTTDGVSARDGLEAGVYQLETDHEIVFVQEIAEDLPAGAVAWYALDPIAKAKAR